MPLAKKKKNHCDNKGTIICGSIFLGPVNNHTCSQLMPWVPTSLSKYHLVANISGPNFAFQRSHETYQKGQISANKAKAKKKKKKKKIIIPLFPLFPSYNINPCVSGSHWNFLLDTSVVIISPLELALYNCLVEVHKNIILEATPGSGLLI